MKAAYVGIDLLYPALPALAAAGCELLKVFTCETDNVTEFNTDICGYARSHGIPLRIGRVTREDLAALRDAGCRLLLCGGYYHRLPVTEDFPMVNIHPSFLPEGRGAWPMPVTILRGLPRSGVTFHKITEELDAGDILLQKAVPVAPGETLQSLMEKQQALLPEMVRELCGDLPRLWAAAKPQGPGSCWPCPTEADWTLRAGMSHGEADRILRAFYGYEVILEQDGERWELIGARLSDGPREGMRCFPFGEKTICTQQARRLAP